MDNLISKLKQTISIQTTMTKRRRKIFHFWKTQSMKFIMIAKEKNATRLTGKEILTIMTMRTK